MFALIQNGVVVSINSVGFDNAVMGENDYVTECDDFSVSGKAHDKETGEFTALTATDEEQEKSRSIAYADVTTGSDRLFQSYQASIANEDEDEVVTAKKVAWLERRAEIQDEYPLSTDSLTTE